MIRAMPKVGPVLRKVSIAGLLLLAACERTDENVTDGGIEEGREMVSCGETLLDPDAIAVNRKRDAELRRRFATEKVDPVAAATEAIEAEDFRLIADGSREDLNDATYGVQCAVANGLDPWTVRGMLAPLQTAGPSTGDLESFARRYNAAVVSDPTYPYGDVCRVADDNLTPTRTGAGFVGLGAPTTRYDAAEAARRGDAWRLRQLRRRDAKLLDRPDDFGMTPLAWAVAYREPVAIDFLLKAGADPSGGGCRTMPDARSPVELARAMKWQSAVLRMRPMLEPGVFEQLREEPRMLEKSEIAYRKQLIEIGSRYEKQLRRQKRSIQRVSFEIDAKGQPTACSIEPGTNVPDFDAEICTVGIATLRWRAARNPFGVEVPGETTIAVRTVGR